MCRCKSVAAATTSTVHIPNCGYRVIHKQGALLALKCSNEGGDLPQDERQNGAVLRVLVPCNKGFVLHAAVESHVDDHQEDHDEKFDLEQDGVTPAVIKCNHTAHVRQPLRFQEYFDRSSM